MASPLRHRLADADLADLAADELTTRIVERLSAAELSKHMLFLEALRRSARDFAPPDAAEIVVAACDVLAQVQARYHDVVADVLRLPHVGFWAATCLSQLRHARGGYPPSAARPFSPPDMTQVAIFAAVAAIRGGHPFELRVPVRAGTVALPTVGTLRLDRARNLRWALISSPSGRGDVTLSADGCLVDVPIGRDDGPRSEKADWIPASRLRTQIDGVALDVVLETFDPFLTQMSPTAANRRLRHEGTWRRRLQAAWKILVRHHRPIAEALGAGLTALVPLPEPGPGGPASAASGHAWGAIALSLPPDGLSCAEILVHEFRHLVLGAVEDLTPVVREDDTHLYYAPWRPDPRPLSGLLQGSFAFFGVTGFWRRQCRTGPPAQRMRGQVEFARGRRDVFEAARTLAGSAALTGAGRALVRGMLDRLAAWQGEPVDAAAEAAASELSAEHCLRWRLAHLHPDGGRVDALARAWLGGQPRPPAGPDAVAALIPAARQLPQGLSRLLELRLRDPERLRRLLADGEEAIDAADAAFVQGDNVTAGNAYLRRVTVGDIGAWTGLFLTMRRTAGPAADLSLPQQPELIAAVFERIRAVSGAAPHPRALIAWLAPERRA